MHYKKESTGMYQVNYERFLKKSLRQSTRELILASLDFMSYIEVAQREQFLFAICLLSKCNDPIIYNKGYGAATCLNILGVNWNM